MWYDRHMAFLFSASFVTIHHGTYITIAQVN